jgi:hypothetical protein
MRIAIACGLVFGAAALLPQVAAAQFPEKKVLTRDCKKDRRNGRVGGGA